MYICICNSIKDKDFARAASSNPDAYGADDLFESLGCSAKCGKCVCFVEEAYLPNAHRENSVAA